MSADDDIIRQRISGRSVREIAKARRCSVAQINEAIDRWTATSIDDKIRKNTLALELARLDDLQETRNLLRPHAGRGGAKGNVH
jgi:hypothetical protein